MAFDPDLADRLRELLASDPDVSEKRMFGGLAFLVHGNMAVSASGQGGLLLRIDPADADALVDGQLVDRMEMRGRPMDGWLRVHEGAVETEVSLGRWVGRGLAYARSLPPK